MSGLVARDRQRLPVAIGDRFSQAGLDVRHGFAQVLPDHALASMLEGIHQGHRQRLLDHGWRVALCDSGKLAAGLGLVQALVMPYSREVQVGDVFAVFEVRHLEDDLTTEASGPGDCLVQHLGSVGRPHEEDVVLGGLQRRDAQRVRGFADSYAHRDDEACIHQAIDQLSEEPPPPGRVVEPVHDDQKHVEGHHAATEHAAHHPAPTTAHPLAPAPQRIELIDEDGAPAPPAGLLLGHPAHHQDLQDVHPQEHPDKGGARGDDDGELQGRGDCLGQHGLSRAGRSDQQDAALAHTACLHVFVSLLDQVQDLGHLLYGSGLAPDI